MSETFTLQMHTVLTLLRRLPPRERLRVIAQALPEVERDLTAIEGPVPHPELNADELKAAESRFKEKLLEMGMITEIRDPMQYPPQEDRIAPVKVKGIPLSEVIVAERR